MPQNPVIRKKNEMNIEEWKKMDESKQIEYCKTDKISPYRDWNLFKAIEAEFINFYGNQPMIAKVHCGFGPGLGPYNAITITILKGKGASKLPKYFLGFPIVKIYQSQREFG